jgi:hypothetical protein
MVEGVCLKGISKEAQDARGERAHDAPAAIVLIEFADVKPRTLSRRTHKLCAKNPYPSQRVGAMIPRQSTGV